MAGRKSRAKIKDDPFVPLSGERLQAAMELRRVGVVWLAEQAGATQQSLSHHVGRSTVGKCRASLRERLARALHVTPGYLAGDPIAPQQWFNAVREGTEYRYSAKTLLAVDAFGEAVRKACLRDCKAAKLNRSETQLVLASVGTGLSNWLEIAQWRPRLLAWTDEDFALQGFTEPPTIDPFGRQGPKLRPDPHHEGAVLGLIAALDHVLRPWFDGDVPLRYAAFREYQVPVQRLRHSGAAEGESNPTAALPTAGS